MTGLVSSGKLQFPEFPPSGLSCACRFVPGPPEGAVHLLFAAAAVDCGAQRRQVRVRLQLVQVLHHQSALGLQLLGGQEVLHLLDTPGVSTMLLQSCEDTNCHLQDVCFLQLGVWLLFEELWTQERLELLDAAVDPLSAQLLHQRLSELQRQQETKSVLLLLLLLWWRSQRKQTNKLSMKVEFTLWVRCS